MAALIEDYGLIGDLQTAALVSRHGCIDWLCLPRFDSGAVFAALLGDSRERALDDSAGRRVPLARSQVRPRHARPRDDLETSSGAVRLIDFMPPRGETPDVVRIVEGVRGRVEMRMELVLRFDYGSIIPWVRNLDGTLVGVAGPDAVSLRTPLRLEGAGHAHLRRLYRRRGRPGAVRADLVRVAQAAARAVEPNRR